VSIQRDQSYHNPLVDQLRELLNQVAEGGSTTLSPPDLVEGLIWGTHFQDFITWARRCYRAMKFGEHEAEDLAQGLGMKLFNIVRQNRTPPKIDAVHWLLAVTRNHGIDIIRRGRTAHDQQDRSGTDAVELPDPGPGPLDEPVRNETLERMRAALKVRTSPKLYPCLLAVMNLTVGGWNTLEIAMELRFGYNKSAQRRVQRYLKKVRTLLTDFMPPPARTGSVTPTRVPRCAGA
jgi:DNA-directed RNA polymerase specialized sigma24 family protein